MAKSKFSRFDVADHLKSEADIIAFLSAVAEEGDPAAFARALGTAARAAFLRDALLDQRTKVKFEKIGGSLAMVLPESVVRDLGIKENASGELTVTGNTISVVVGQPKYSLAQLLKESPDELPIDQDFERTKPVGREKI